jgi:DNA-binding transcriptional LysR family regulator
MTQRFLGHQSSPRAPIASLSGARSQLDATLTAQRHSTRQLEEPLGVKLLHRTTGDW